MRQISKLFTSTVDVASVHLCGWRRFGPPLLLTSLRSTFAVDVASVHLCCSGQVSVLASRRPVGATWLLRVWIFPASWQHLPEGTCTTNRPLRPSLYQSFTGHESPAFQSFRSA
ncbi:hypothetical protein ElyMa_001656800 [Elysia marginata]|uniref:Secreted protein n=1 Tax=Elysia marginata TaxID=1093978 RepID=A0AAV4JN25_9GAST|nr:hypothetical protein ElyMa_001656800 [Elysia marginata]